MTKTQNLLPGLKPRLEAAFHLNAILRGKPFAPIGADTLADRRDRALANRLVTVVLRRHGQISAILEAVLKKGVPPRSAIFEPVLRLGIAQLLYMDGIPAHSALHLSIEALRTDHRAGRFDRLANGVLRQIQREAERFLALPHSLLFPVWLRAEWETAYGTAALERFEAAMLEGAPLDLTLRQMDDALVTALGAEPVLVPTVRLATRDAAVADLPGFAQGKWWVQDAAAAIPARFVRARPGMRVLDLCAAPGGKTAQLAAAGADIVALDRDETRMARLTANLDRLGLTAESVVVDALDYAPSEKFDAVLLDAPCSATGTFRRHPEVVWQRDAGGIAERVALQRRLIDHALTLLKPGGTLVYCVCSLELAEGEGQADWVLEAHTDVTLDPVTPQELDGWTAPILASGAMRLTPAHEVPGTAGGTLDGFFAMRLRRA